MEIFITRHGESDPSFPEPDLPLTEKGEEQARLLGERMKNEKIDYFYSSPLVRAVRTASYTAEKFGGEIRILPLLFEVGTPPDFVSKSEEEMKEIYPYVSFPMGEKTSPCEETDEESFERAKKAIEYIVTHHKENDTVFIAAHGTFNNLLTLAALGFPNRENFNFSQDNTGLTLIRYITDNKIQKTKAAYVNCTRHLPEELI